MQKILEFLQNINLWAQGLFDSLGAVLRALRQTFVFIDDLVGVLPTVLYGVLFASFVVIVAKLVVGRN